LLELLDRGAPALVDGEQVLRREQLLRLRIERTAVERPVVLGRMFANEADIVHEPISWNVRFGESARSYNARNKQLANASLPVLTAASGAPFPFFRFPKRGLERREAPPADRRRLANPNPGSAARHGRSPVTRGCRFRARGPSDVGPGASRRSNAVPV